LCKQLDTSKLFCDKEGHSKIQNEEPCSKKKSDIKEKTSEKKAKEITKPKPKDKEKEAIISKEKKIVEREKAKTRAEKEKATKQKERQKEKDKKVKQKNSEKKEKENEKKQKKIEEKEAKPKKAITAFSVYFSEQFPSVRKQNANAKVPAIAKIIAQKWNSLSDVEKKPFVAKSEEDKKRHKKEMDEYKKTLPPKRPPSGYLVFSNEKRGSLMQAKPGASMADIAKLLGQEWKKLAESKKEGYNKAAQKALAEWKQKVEQFKS